MKRPVRTRTDPDEVRARILGVAEEHFRRIGYHKTSVADIASELGMSPANVYRFFPSKGAINECICGRVVNEVAEIAVTIARTHAPALEKLDRLLTAVHHHYKTTLIKEKRMHDMIVAAMQENWAIIKAHIERMVTIFEAIIREGIEAGEFKVEDPAEAARAVKTAFTPFFHPILIEQCLQHGENTEAALREQIRFILKALGKSD
jgi:AcrR family transcriptional regulator